MKTSTEIPKNILDILTIKTISHYMKALLKKILRIVLGKRLYRTFRFSIAPTNFKINSQKRRNFYKQFLQKGDLYFDVGANYGNRISPLINEGIRIIAIEPQIRCLKYLYEEFKNEITIIPKGLSATVGFQPIYQSKAHVLSTFSNEWIETVKRSGRFGGVSWEKNQEIEMTTLDNLIMEYGRPAFVKIDVEGYELEVLKGLSQPVPVISIEYTVPEAKHTLLNCIDRLTEVGNGGEVLFNYSVGESMEWALGEWVDSTQIKTIIDSELFLKSCFGDVYIKTITNNH